MKPNEIIKELRKAAKVNQQEAADVLNMSRPNYTNKENGKVPFTIDEFCMIMQFFEEHIMDESIFTTGLRSLFKLMAKKNKGLFIDQYIEHINLQADQLVDTEIKNLSVKLTKEQREWLVRFALGEIESSNDFFFEKLHQDIRFIIEYGGITDGIVPFDKEIHGLID